MQTCISFLRGVNMTGHNKINMAELTTLFKKSGFKDAETYIQSGNVIFNNAEKLPLQQIALKIEEEISRKFRYTIPAIIRTTEDVREIISANPFSGEENFDPARLAVILLYEYPRNEQIEKVRDVKYPPDKFKIIGREIFIYCPNGFGKTKLYTNFFEKKMAVIGTARNWKTINTTFQVACAKNLKES
jgi:uncharacterized protein (DUF1697 family)